MEFENETTEFKSQVTDSLYKEVIAFANTDGGIIYIGIDDSSNKAQIRNIRNAYHKKSSALYRRQTIFTFPRQFVRQIFSPQFCL